MIGSGREIRGIADIAIFTLNTANKSRLGLVNPFTGLPRPSVSGVNANIAIANPASGTVTVLFTDFFIGLQGLVRPNHIFIFTASSINTINLGAINPIQLTFTDAVSTARPIEAITIGQSAILSANMIIDEAGNYIRALNGTSSSNVKITCQWWAIP